MLKVIFTLFVLNILSGCSSSPKFFVEEGFAKEEVITSSKLIVTGFSEWMVEKHSARQIAYNKALQRAAYLLNPQTKVNSNYKTIIDSNQANQTHNENVYIEQSTFFSKNTSFVISKIKSSECFYKRRNSDYAYQYNCILYLN